MTDGFTPSPVLDAHGELPGFGELLGSQNFLERMDAARIRRAQVLAERPQDPDSPTGLLKNTQPWKGATIMRLRPRLPVLHLQAPVSGRSRSGALLRDRPESQATALTLPVATDLTPVAAAPGRRRADISALRIAGGFAFGLGLGFGALSVVQWARSGTPAPEVATGQPPSAVAVVAVASAPASPPLARPEVATVVGKSLPPLPYLPPAKPAEIALWAPPASAWSRVPPLAIPALAENPVAAVSTRLPPMWLSDKSPIADLSVVSLVAYVDGALGERNSQLPRGLTRIATLAAPARLEPGVRAQEVLLPVVDVPAPPPRIIPARFAVPVPPVLVDPVISWNAPSQGRTGDIPVLIPARLPVDNGIAAAALMPPAPFTGANGGTDDGTGLMDLGAYTLSIHAPASMDETDLQDFSAILADSGFGVADPTRVGFTISTNHVRYYHAGDADAARIAAEQIGGPARDFTAFRPSPPAGKVEIWLAGKAGSRTVASGQAQRKTQRKAQPLSPEEAQLRALRDLLIQQLRTGQHL